MVLEWCIDTGLDAWSRAGALSPPFYPRTSVCLAARSGGDGVASHESNDM